MYFRNMTIQPHQKTYLRLSVFVNLEHYNQTKVIMTNLCGAHSDSSQLYIYQNYHHISILVSLNGAYNFINYSGLHLLIILAKLAQPNQSKALTTAQLSFKMLTTISI